MNEWFLETKTDAEHADDADVSLCIELNETREYTIGRRKGYDIVSPNPLVSRKHGVITLKPDGLIYVRDLKSANGTYINDKAIEPFRDWLLNNNDLLGIGAPTTATEEKKEIFWVRRRPKKNANAIVSSIETSFLDNTPVQNNPENGVSSTSTAHISAQNNVEQVVASDNKTLVQLKSKNTEQVLESNYKSATALVPAQIRSKNIEQEEPSTSRTITGSVQAQIKSKNAEQVVASSSRSSTTLISAHIRSKKAEKEELSTSRTTIELVPAQIKSKNAEQVVASPSTSATTLISPQIRSKNVELEEPSTRRTKIGSVPAQIKSKNTKQVVASSSRSATTLIPPQIRSKNAEKEELSTSRTTIALVPAQIKSKNAEQVVASSSRSATTLIPAQIRSKNAEKEELSTSRTMTGSVPAQIKSKNAEQLVGSPSTSTTTSISAQIKSKNAEKEEPSTSRTITGSVPAQIKSKYAEQVVASPSRSATTLIPAQISSKNAELEEPSTRKSPPALVPAQIKPEDAEQVVASTGSLTVLTPAQIRCKNKEQLLAHASTSALVPKVETLNSVYKTNKTKDTSLINSINSNNNIQEPSCSTNTKSTNEFKLDLKNGNNCAKNKISSETSDSGEILKNVPKRNSFHEEDKKDVLTKLNLNNKNLSNDSPNLSIGKKDTCSISNDDSTFNKSVENRKTLLLQKSVPENINDNEKSDNFPEKDNIAPNEKSESSNEDVKLGVEYFDALIEKRQKSKSNYIEINLCTSDEDDGEIIKSNSLNTTPVETKPNIADIKITNQKSNESFEKDVQVKSEPQNYSFSQNEEDDILIISDDEDIFPRSQLFDVSVKQERDENVNDATTGDTSPISDDNNEELNQDIFSNIKNEVHDYDYNNENDDDDDDDCILWYSKLSQSQDFISAKRKIEPSPDEPDAGDAADKEFIASLFNDRECSFETDIQKPNDDFRKSKLISTYIEDERIFETDNQKPDDDIRKSRAISTDIEDEEVITKDKSDENELTKSKHVSDKDSRLVDKSIPSTSKLSLSGDKEEEKSSKKKTETKKSYVKPPVIDAPFMVKGKRKAHEEIKIKDKKAPVSKRRKSSYEEISPVTPPVNTAVQSSVLNKSVRTELDKRNKKRRQSIDSYSKDEKIKIQEDRKKKLKELASKSTDNKEKKETQKSHTKPKVKVSSGRGLFLTGAEPKQTSSKKKSDGPLEEEPASKKFKIPKRSDSVSSEPSTSKTNTAPKPNFAKINKLSFTDLNKKPSKTDSKESSTSKTNKVAGKNVTESHKERTNYVPESHKEREIVERRPSISNYIIPHKSTLTGILLHPDRVKKPKKTVRIKEGHDIKYIEKLPGNNWRKVTVKDAPIPDIHNIRETEEIISTVLEWRPAWLEEQKGKNISPEVSKRRPLRMLTNFNSIGDYFNIVQPLMLLELWKSVFRDWCTSSANVKLACIEKIMHKDASTFITCYCLADKNDYDLPKYGDLILSEYYLNNVDSRIGTNKKFGYVLYANKRRMIPTDVVHKQFSEMGPVPPFKLTFTMQIKRSPAQILDEKLMRIRFVSRIAPPLRIFKSVSYLNNSPLRNLILKPSVQQYKITKPNQMTSAIEDNLNGDQMVCIYEAYQICTRNEPGIYLIQGPPGTGKSFVIKNLVRQLLCGASKNQQKTRILLCAPSNGAVDEITNTLLDMRCKLSKSDRFKMIRIGPPNAIVHPKVKSISVQDLVVKNMQTKQNNNLKTNSYMSGEYDFLIKKENTLKNKISSLEARNVDYSIDLHNLRKVQVQIEQLKSNSNLYYERRKEERDAEAFLIENADIICTTLSSCISAFSRLEELVAERKIEFTCCIIDEATQSHEQESLIPLILGIKKFVLVGDPEQLPPTTISQEAKELGYGNSLFSRIQSCFDHLPDNPIRMLTHQYRMHPEICKFPSQTFYGGRLKTATSVLNRNENVLDPFRLFSLNTSKNYKESEYLNKTEANLVLLLTDIVTRKTRYNVGIITPYTKQKDYLINSYRAMRAKENKENLDEDRHLSRVAINTVDGFQGQERDVIIISSVRYKSNVFLNDLQRLNVALTRAKHAVFICAHSDLFKTESIWKQLECDAKSRNCFYLIGDQDTTDEKYMSELILKHSNIS